MESFFSGRSSRFGKSSVKNRKISARRVEIPSNDSYPSLVLTLERDDFSSLRLRVRPGGDVILRMPRTLPEVSDWILFCANAHGLYANSVNWQKAAVPVHVATGSKYLSGGKG